jgi:hypothetical protein
VWQLGNATPLEIVTQASYASPVEEAGIACDANGDIDFAWQTPFSGLRPRRSSTANENSGFDQWTPQSGTTAPQFVKTLETNFGYERGFAIGPNGSLVSGNELFAKKQVLDPTVVFYERGQSDPKRACDAPAVEPEFQRPTAIAFEPNLEHMWVADLESATLYRLATRTCAVTDTIVTGVNGGPFDQLDGVAIDPES